MKEELPDPTNGEQASAASPIQSDDIVDHFADIKRTERGVRFPLLQRRKSHEPPQASDYVAGADINDIQHEPKSTKVTLMVGGAALVVSVAGIIYAIYHRRHRPEDDSR